MTASTKPKTPSMTLAVRPDASEEDTLSFCKRASRLTLSELIEKVEVNEQLLRSRFRRYRVNIHFYPKDEYREEHDVEASEILAAFGVRFPQLLRKEIIQEFKKLSADVKSLTQIGKGQAVSQSQVEADDDNLPAEMPSGRDDASEVGDGDADAEKRALQAKEVANYDSDEEDDGPQGEYDEAAIEAEFAELDNGKSNDEDPDNSSEAIVIDLEGQIREVKEGFFRNLKSATTFTFTEESVHFNLEVHIIMYFNQAS